MGRSPCTGSEPATDPMGETEMQLASTGHETIHGKVSAGFERVREAFADNFRLRGERGAACTIYHRGRKVVDLWGGQRSHHSDAAWNEDTLSLAFSVTKGMAAAAMAVAHSRGWFELDAPVAEYWPEFGCHGKSAITVRELLAHQAGLVSIQQQLNPRIISDHDRMAELIADQQPAWRPGARHGYHTLTLGWYQNELIRRLDPRGRSLGQFFEDEIAKPLDAEFYIGVPDRIDEDRISQTRGFHRLQLLTNLDQLPWKMVLAGIWPRSVVARSVGFLRVDDPATLCSPEYRSVEIPSAGGFGEARAVAKIYNALARRDPRLGLSQATLDELTADTSSPSGGDRDAVLKIDTRYAMGFSRPSGGLRFGSDPRAFGCPGAGGSFGMADPGADLAYAYLTNAMSFRIFDDPRERAVREACYECIAALSPDSLAAA
jgi:CubicO group peptidase (beta-lactamase class C family)